jgi:hypothetical protein
MEFDGNTEPVREMAKGLLEATGGGVSVLPMLFPTLADLQQANQAHLEGDLVLELTLGLAFGREHLDVGPLANIF